jgi:hypothetical protein
LARRHRKLQVVCVASCAWRAAGAGAPARARI